MRKALSIAGLSIAALAATAGVGNASTPGDIDSNEHANVAGNHGGVNLAVSDVLTNTHALNNVHVLDKGVNVAPHQVDNR